MFEDIVGNNGVRFIVAAAAVAAGLLLLVLVFWFLRNRPSSPFVRGGRNRTPRLAVLDAAAVDTRRRLVLVRRDDVEHLIMIGGPTDIVIETRIVGARSAADQPNASAPVATGNHPQQAVPASAPAAPAAAPFARQPGERRPEPRAAQPPVPAQPVILAAPVSSQPPVSAMGQALYGDEAAALAPSRPQPVSPQPAPVRPAPPPPRAIAPAPPRPPVEPPRAPEDILDAARSRVLANPAPAARPLPQPPSTETAASGGQAFERLLDAQISGDLGRLEPEPVNAEPQPVEPPSRAGSPRNEPSLEEEMNRMLNEMSADRRT